MCEMRQSGINLLICSKFSSRLGCNLEHIGAISTPQRPHSTLGNHFLETTKNVYVRMRTMNLNNIIQNFRKQSQLIKRKTLYTVYRYKNYHKHLCKNNHKYYKSTEGIFIIL